MSKVRSIQFSPDEFIAGTVGMTHAEVGVYWKICALIYSTGGPVSEDDERLFSGRDRRVFTQKIINGLIKHGKLLRVDVSKLYQARCDHELKASRNRIEGASKASHARWQSVDKQQDTNATAFSSAMPSQSQPKPKPNTPGKPGQAHQDAFDRFWKNYPSRGSAANPKVPAWKAFLAAIKRGAGPDELAKRAAFAAPADQHGTQFVPMASTWLNQDRWKDDGAPTMAPSVPELPPLDMNGWHRAAWIEFGAVFFKSWIATTVESRVGDDVALVFASRFQAAYVRDHYGDALRKLIRKHDASIAKVTFTTAQPTRIE